jgi:hypothetical protein
MFLLKPISVQDRLITKLNYASPFRRGIEGDNKILVLRKNETK